MIKKIKRSLIENIKNIPGWSTKRKIVAFISDDWGDLRIHSEADFKKLVSNGIPVDKHPRTRFETLANYEDLELLFNVLRSVKDRQGRSAVLSPLTIMANPDFIKIEANDFREYHYNLFTDTLKEYENGEDTISKWRQGIDEKIFLPELHGREHINVPLWMRKLQSGDERYRISFNHRYVYNSDSELETSIVAAYNFQNEDDFRYIDDALCDGIQQFESVFGYRPSVFNPPNAIFHPRFYPTLKGEGIDNIDTRHYRMEPDGKGGLVKSRYRFGEVSQERIVHFISNCAFEPIKDNPTVVEDTLSQVASAFRWNKPALINTHRINYVKGRGGKHRERCLDALSALLNKITETWPDVEFMGIGEFCNYMNSTLEEKLQSVATDQ